MAEKDKKDTRPPGSTAYNASSIKPLVTRAPSFNPATPSYSGGQKSTLSPAGRQTTMASAPPPAYATSTLTGSNAEKGNTRQANTKLLRDGPQVGQPGPATYHPSRYPADRKTEIPPAPQSTASKLMIGSRVSTFVPPPLLSPSAMSVLAQQSKAASSIMQGNSLAPQLQSLSLRQSTIPSSSQQPSTTSKAPSKAASKAPRNAPSILLTPEDIAMTSRQTSIESMTPVDRQSQELWAQDMVKRTGVCPAGFGWARRPGGYQCYGGAHAMTDELIEEGRGGMWTLDRMCWGLNMALYYPDPLAPGRYLLCAVNPGYEYLH